MENTFLVVVVVAVTRWEWTLIGVSFKVLVTQLWFLFSTAVEYPCPLQSIVTVSKLVYMFFAEKALKVKMHLYALRYSIQLSQVLKVVWLEVLPHVLIIQLKVFSYFCDLHLHTQYHVENIIMIWIIDFKCCILPYTNVNLPLLKREDYDCVINVSSMYKLLTCIWNKALRFAVHALNFKLYMYQQFCF